MAMQRTSVAVGTGTRPATVPLAPKRVEIVQETEGGAVDVMKQLLSGGAGGIAQVLVGHPFDTVKTKLQIQSTSNAKYTGMSQCFRSIVKEEGFRGLYKGAFSPIAGAVLHNANVFFSYGVSKKVVNRLTSPTYHTDADSEENMSTAQFFAAGGLAGVTISVVETPVDLFKIKMQAQGTRGIYTGSVDCARKIFAAHGIRGMYQGNVATIVRNVPAFGCYFGSYEFTKRALTPAGEKPSLLASFLGGSCAGFGFWATVYPLELVKTRMQSQSSDIAKRQYAGVVDCFRKCLATEGWAGLYKGFVPCVTRAVPVNGAIFLAVATAKSLLTDDEA